MNNEDLRSYFEHSSVTIEQLSYMTGKTISELKVILNIKEDKKR
jgi:hypothetical protein